MSVLGKVEKTHIWNLNRQHSTLKYVTELINRAPSEGTNTIDSLGNTIDELYTFLFNG